MMRGATILWAVLATIAGGGLFTLKYEVQTQEERLAGLHKDITDAQDSIHVLKAEWSYLNEPQHLREQAERYLGLHTMKPNQIATIDSLPMADPVVPSVPPADAPLAASSPDGVASPVSAVTVPGTPETRAPSIPSARAPEPSATHSAPKDVLRSKKPAKSAKTMVARARPIPVVPAARPAAPPVRVASVKTAATPVKTPRPAAMPASPSYPTLQASAPAIATSANVMVIKSPALMEPEMVSTGARQ
jgi:hypothetical protein